MNLWAYEGAGFLFPEKILTELGNMPSNGYVVDYEESRSFNSDLYANDINYLWHGDLDNEDFDPIEPSIELNATVFSIGKLQSSHPVTDGGDLTWGNRVFGHPLAVANVTGQAEFSQVDITRSTTTHYQFQHSSSVELEFINYNNITDSATYKMIAGSMQTTDGVVLADFIGREVVVSYLLRDADREQTSIREIDQSPPALNDAISGNDIALQAEYGEVECVITGVVDLGSDQFNITVQATEAYEEYMLISGLYLAPDNQEIMIASLGRGDLVTDGDKWSLNNDSMQSPPSILGLQGFSYIQDLTILTKPKKGSTPILRLELDPLEVHKLFVITVKNPARNIFSTGIHFRLFQG